MTEDLTKRLTFAIDYPETATQFTADAGGFACQCDPDVGVQCELCSERQLLLDVRREIERLQTEVEDTRNAIKLIIGREINVFWRNVHDDAVNSCVEGVKALRKMRESAGRDPAEDPVCHCGQPLSEHSNAGHTFLEMDR